MPSKRTPPRVKGKSLNQRDGISDEFTGGLDKKFYEGRNPVAAAEGAAAEQEGVHVPAFVKTHYQSIFGEVAKQAAKVGDEVFPDKEKITALVGSAASFGTWVSNLSKENINSISAMQEKKFEDLSAQLVNKFGRSSMEASFVNMISEYNTAKKLFADYNERVNAFGSPEDVPVSARKNFEGFVKKRDENKEKFNAAERKLTLALSVLSDTTLDKKIGIVQVGMKEYSLTLLRDRLLGKIQPSSKPPSHKM